MEAIDVNEQVLADRDLYTLEMLLTDKTTKGHLRWATDAYAENGEGFLPSDEMRTGQVIGVYTTLIRPRVAKSEEERRRRTREKGEVFTPAWVCNAQNNLVDRAWFGRDPGFNTETERGWTTSEKPIEFDEEHTWQAYVDKRMIEVACGEAPYITSRYDASSGKEIEVADRIGLLDRKLRVVSENADDEEEWMKWAERAVQSCYAYDYQGDNVLLARENALVAVDDAHEAKYGVGIETERLRPIANVIAWNIFQMDGMTGMSPFTEGEPVQLRLPIEGGDEEPAPPVPCLVYDWRSRMPVEFRSLMRKGTK